MHWLGDQAPFIFAQWQKGSFSAAFEQFCFSDHVFAHRTTQRCSPRQNNSFWRFLDLFVCCCLAETSCFLFSELLQFLVETATSSSYGATRGAAVHRETLLILISPKTTEATSDLQPQSVVIKKNSERSGESCRSLMKSSRLWISLLFFVSC